LGSLDSDGRGLNRKVPASEGGSSWPLRNVLASAMSGSMPLSAGATRYNLLVLT